MESDTPFEVVIPIPVPVPVPVPVPDDDLIAEISDLRAELAAMRHQRDEATAWRPIETAPMDGMAVMLYGDGRVTCGSWIAEQDITVSDHVGCYPSGETTPAYWQSHDGGFTEEHPPTHWMPLPQPPREKEGGGA